LREPRIAQLAGRNVDREAKPGCPVAGVDKGLADQAFGQDFDQADFFRDRNEDVRADLGRSGRLPPRQHFKAGQLAGAQVDLLLIERNEFILDDPVANAGFKLAAQAQRLFHRRIEPAMTVPAALFRVIHGDVGIVQQGRRFFARIRKVRGNAGGDRGFDFRPGEMDRARDGTDQALDQMVDLVRTFRRIADRAGKFIAANSRQQGILGEDFGEAARRFDQQGVPGGVAVEVVDLLELVEVQHDDGDSLALLSGFLAQTVGGRAQRAPVEQAGQGVGFRQQPGLFLGPAARCNLVGQFAVALPAQHHDGDVEQQGSGQQPVRPGPIAQHRTDRIRDDRAADADEHDDGSQGNAPRSDVAFRAPQVLFAPGLQTLQSER